MNRDFLEYYILHTGPTWEVYLDKESYRPMHRQADGQTNQQTDSYLPPPQHNLGGGRGIINILLLWQKFHCTNFAKTQKCLM